MKLKELTDFLEEFTPLGISENWDNVGLLVGDKNSDIKNILICLDITNEVIEEALENNANLIISHHPLIFKGIKRINKDNCLGNKLINCIKNDISVYTMHTNFDLTFGGTNDILFDILGLINKENLAKEDASGYSLGRIGEYSEEINLGDFALFIKEKLGLKSIKFVGDRNKKIKKVALATGSCSNYEMFDECTAKKCDVYITSDIKHHESIDALEMGLCLIDATHYGSEFIMVKSLAERIRDFSNKNNYSLKIIESEKNKPVFDYI